ncbi:MAG: NUDIX domain-containing protein [Bacteroidales bacterium]
MYSIFFNNRRLQLCRPDSPVCLLPSVTLAPSDRSGSWEDLIAGFECNSNINHLVIPVEDPLESFKQLCSRFVLFHAAGGVVTNKNGDVLMIYRYGRWDLPKGKQEPGESLWETALREVAEETGARGLQITGDQFAATYHTYRFQGKNVLKTTAWFRMTAEERSSLNPQTEEGIEKTEWVSLQDMEKYLEASYASIRLLIRSKILLNGEDVGKAGQIEDIPDLGPEVADF